MPTWPWATWMQVLEMKETEIWKSRKKKKTEQKQED